MYSTREHYSLATRPFDHIALGVAAAIEEKTLPRLYSSTTSF